MNDILYLEPDDEITAVIDRLRTCRSAGVVLAIPRGSVLAQSSVNLKILKRNAEEMEKEIFLVTSDRIARNIASQIGLTVYSKVSEAERAKTQIAPAPHVAALPERRPAEQREEAQPQAGTSEQEPEGGFRVNSYARYKASLEDEAEEVDAADREEQEAEEVEAAPEDESFAVPGDHEIEDVAEHLLEDQSDFEEEHQKPVPSEAFHRGAPMTKKSFRGARRILVVIFAVMVVSGVAFAYVFLPYASASVQLKTEDYDTSSEVKVDRNAKAVDAKSAVIPGTLVEVEKEQTKSFPSTGTKDAGANATGKMTVYNGYDTSSHKYPKGTKFTSGGKTFVADAEFSVGPATIALAGGSVNITPGEGTVTVTAAESGDSYNLAAGNYTVVGTPAKITAKGGEMTGGVTKTIKVVTEKDLTDAETALKSEIENSAKQEVKDKASGTGLTLLEDGLVSEVVSENHSQDADAEADTFDFTVKLKTFGLGFSQSDLRSMEAELVSNQLKDTKMLVSPDKSELTFELKESSRDVESATLNVNFKGKVAPKMEETTVKNLIRNKSMGAAVAVLKQQDTVMDAKIDVWPTFLGRTPIIVQRLKVEFDYAK